MDRDKFKKAQELEAEITKLNQLKINLTEDALNHHHIVKMSYTTSGSSDDKGGQIHDIPRNLISDLLPLLTKGLNEIIETKQKEFEDL